ncbi:MAG: hypothetical protein IJF07_04805, partial [Lachnospiraceae bacterium]|nr:hypothetical protein [Lachnospiraceae bacterium]
IDRGDEFPPIPSERYYKDVFVDDERLQRDVVCEKHTDYSVDAHGITTNMEEARRTEFTVKYLREKLIERYNLEAIALLLYGNYGYRIPDKLYATNIDLVFEEVIPYAYEKCKERGPYAGSNFLRTLRQAIVNGYWSREVLSKAWIEDGQVVHPDNNYLFWMNIRIHLKLAEVHKTNREPYNLLDLSNVSYWLEKSYDQYLYKHDKVFWHGNVVCEDIGEFVKSALKELEYFKRFQV